MGIERFFSSINRNFNVVDEVVKLQKIKCKTLLIDFNSIIHTISSKLIKELNQKGSTKYTDYKIEDIEELILLEIKNYLIDLFNTIEISNLIYIALDGVPTFSKIIEQKKRRFIGDLIEQLLSKYSLPFSFNKSLIGPGTKFMDKVIKLLNDKSFNKKIIISDTNEKGEGEFKILDYILKNNLDDVIIYSPDADLIILSMIIWANSRDKYDNSRDKNYNSRDKYDNSRDKNYNFRIQILRYDQNTEILNIIYINHLIDYLFSYFEDRVKNTINIKKYINDLCFIFTVFGNDFLPKIEDININMDFYLILDAYIINYIDNGYLLNDNLDIVPKALFNYLSFLNQYETFLLKRNDTMYKYQNFNYAQTINLYLDIKNKKHNPAAIFYIDFGANLDKNTKYGKLEYYFYDINKLFGITNYEYKNNFNQTYIDNPSNLRYQKLIPIEYKSSIKKHLLTMKDMSPREKEMYLINNKLDKYYSLFNPNKIKRVHSGKELVHQYLKGSKWLVNYYYKRQDIDETWAYPYHESPLLNDFVNYFDAKLLNYQFKNIELNIKPLEQLLYITPIRLSNIDAFINILNISNSEKNKIINFIENNVGLFYNLDEIYYSILSGNLNKDLLNCSSATFISKCHYFILDDIKPINKFKI